MFFGMMRVKNEERWLERSLSSLIKVCDTIFVLDDHSTDATSDIIKSLRQCVYLKSPFNHLDESRDKTWLLGHITDTRHEKEFHKHSPHWVICIDGDEEICDVDVPKILETTGNVSYSFQILQLHDSPGERRVDGAYEMLLRPSMFRIIKPGMIFKSGAQHGGGFHCGNVPADIGFGVTVHQPEPVRVKHYGYMRKEDRERKYKWYVERDPGHEDWYRRECFGVGVETVQIKPEEV